MSYSYKANGLPSNPFSRDDDDLFSYDDQMQNDEDHNHQFTHQQSEVKGGRDLSGLMFY